MDDVDRVASGKDAVDGLDLGGKVPLVLVVWQALEFGNGADVPVVSLESAVISLERVDGLVGGFVFKRDKAGAVRGGSPRGHLTDDGSFGSANAGGAGLKLGGTVALAKTPVISVLVPHDSLQTEDLSGDGADTSVNVALRGTPVHGNQSGQIVDDLHGPAKVTENLHVSLAGLKGVRPGVDTEVHGWISLDVLVHGGRVPDDGGTDEEVGSALLLCLKVLDEIRRLGGRAIIEGDGNIVVRSKPDITGVALLNSPRADIGHVSAGRVDGSTSVGVSNGTGDGRNETGSLLSIVSVDPCLGKRALGGRVGTSRRVRHSVLGGGGELTLGEAVMVVIALGEEVASGVLGRVEKASLVTSRSGDEGSGQSHGSYGQGGETHGEGNYPGKNVKGKCDSGRGVGMRTPEASRIDIRKDQ